MFKHLQEKNMSYLEHLLFACGIGARLLLTGLVFVIHGLLPLAAIPKRLNLEETGLYLFEKDNSLSV